jgi:hypothetical protein
LAATSQNRDGKIEACSCDLHAAARDPPPYASINPAMDKPIQLNLTLERFTTNRGSISIFIYFRQF